MTTIFLDLPDDVAREYFLAAEKLSAHFSSIGETPDAQTLMNFTLASLNSDDIARNFDWSLHHMLSPREEDESEEIS